jgi:hypothetical protein
LIFYKMWDPRSIKSLWTFPDSYRDNIFLYFADIIKKWSKIFRNKSRIYFGTFYFIPR